MYREMAEEPSSSSSSSSSANHDASSANHDASSANHDDVDFGALSDGDEFDDGGDGAVIAEKVAGPITASRRLASSSMTSSSAASSSSLNSGSGKEIKDKDTASSKKEKKKKDKNSKSLGFKFKLFDGLINYFLENVEYVASKFKEPTVFPETSEGNNNGDSDSNRNSKTGNGGATGARGARGGSRDCKEVKDWSYLEKKPPSRMVPVMVWHPPCPIAYLTPLTTDQLNAVCYSRTGRDIEGEIVYSPVLNTILPAGIHTLRAIFIPKEMHRYENVEREVIIEVTRAAIDVIWHTDIDEILYSIPLPQAMFCAQCTNGLPGKFKYTHSPGALLN